MYNLFYTEIFIRKSRKESDGLEKLLYGLAAVAVGSTISVLPLSVYILSDSRLRVYKFDLILVQNGSAEIYLGIPSILQIIVISFAACYLTAIAWETILPCCSMIVGYVNTQSIWLTRMQKSW